MTNAELIECLRCENENYGDCNLYESDCKYRSGIYCTYWQKMHDAADAIEKLMAEIGQKDKVIKDMLTTLTGMKDKLIERICANCDTPPETRLRLCGECPIISPIREAFDEQPT